MRSCKSPAGRLESHQRGFWIETPLLCPGDLLSKSSKLAFPRKRWWGDSPLLMLEEWKARYNKADRLVWGQMHEKIQQGSLKARLPFACLTP